MRRNEKRKLLKLIEGLNTALKQSSELAEAAVAALVETKALLLQSTANADQWRQLCEAAQNGPVVVEPAVDFDPPYCRWIN